MSTAVAAAVPEDELAKSARDLRTKIREQRAKLETRYRRLLKSRKVWQTVVVLATSISTALAGYVAQKEIALSWRLGLVFVVAVAGTVAAVRDAWQVNEAVDDAKERYSEIRALSAELAQAQYDAEGSIRSEDRVLKLAPVVKHVQSRLDDLADELSELSGKKNPN